MRRGALLWVVLLAAAPGARALRAPGYIRVQSNTYSLTVSWGSVPGASYYEVDRSLSRYLGSSVSFRAYSTSWADTLRLERGQTYYYRVRAVDGYGVKGPFSSYVSAEVAAPAIVGASGSPESPHPYPHRYDRSWTYYGPADATALRVTFHRDTYTEPYFDRIDITDASGGAVTGSPFYGSELASRTLTIPGRSFSIRLRTDSSVAYWGFAITGIQAVLPPPPPVPVVVAPFADATIGGVVELKWAASPGASSYEVEWSTDTRSWSRISLSALRWAPDLGKGRFYWRVRAKSGSQAGGYGPTRGFTVSEGYDARLVERGRDRLRLAFTPYRGPGEAELRASGLPPGVRVAFDPPRLIPAASGGLTALSGPSGGEQEVSVSLSGLESVQMPGEYSFTVAAGTLPVSGDATLSFTVAAGIEIGGLHAYPNPARIGSVRIKAAISKTPARLQIAIYDLSGALVKRVDEQSPFPSFTASGAGVYEYRWDGRNDTGRRVASEKYLYRFEAESAAGSDSAQGVLTFLWP